MLPPLPAGQLTRRRLPATLHACHAPDSVAAAPTAAALAIGANALRI